MAIQQKTFNSELPNLLTQLMGQKTTSSSTTGGNVAPLQAVFNQSMQPMDTQLFQNLVGSIQNQAAQQIPELTTALANATNTRSSGNSALALGLQDLQNRANMSSAQQILNYNLSQQQNALGAAKGIADSSRTVNQTQKQGSGTNPLLISALGWGANQLDKRGVFDKVGDAIGGMFGGTDPVNAVPQDIWSMMGEGTAGIWSGAGPMADTSNFVGGAGGMDFGLGDAVAGWAGDAFSGAGDFLGGAVDTVADWGSSLFDSIGGFFGWANGGTVNSNTGPSGMIPARANAPMQVADAAAMGQDPNAVMQQILMQALMAPPVQAPPINPINFLRYLLPTSGFNIHQYANGGTLGGRAPRAGYADGGIVRNRNNLGGPLQRQGMNVFDPSMLSAGGFAPGGSGNNLNSNFLAEYIQQARERAVQSNEAQQRMSNADSAVAAPGVGDPATNAAAVAGFMGTVASMGLAALGLPPGLTQALGIPSFPSFIVNQISQAVNGPAGVAGGDAAAGGVSAPSDGVSTQGVDTSNPDGFSIGPADGPSDGGVSDGSDGSGEGVGAAGSATGGGDGVASGDGPGSWKNGGKIVGPGTGTSDSIRAKPRVAGEMPVSFSNGEFIFSRKATEFYGEDLLTQMLMKAHAPV
jgi:hypothetical protein